LYKWFAAVHSEGKYMTGPMIIHTAECLYDKMRITDRCTFSDGWLQNFKDSTAEGDIQMDYSLE
jgi:hypothetical protein